MANAGSTFTSLLGTITTTANAATSLVSAIGTTATATGVGASMLLAYAEAAAKQQRTDHVLDQVSHEAVSIRRQQVKRIEEARALQAMNLSDEEKAFATALEVQLRAALASSK